MASTLISSSSSSLLSFHPLFSPRNPIAHHRTRRLSIPRINASSSSHRSEANGKNYHGGRLVDENMIVLRKRIHEMKMIERNYEPPSHWMDWEKRYYSNYDSMICEMVGLLQTLLMNSRPSVAFGTLALVLLSVPASTAVVAFRLLDIAKAVLATVHVG